MLGRVGQWLHATSLSDLRGQVLDRAVGKLSEASTAAADTLRALLDADSETVRLGAGRSILELGARLREALELEARLAALEQKLGEGDGERQTKAS